MPIKEFIRHKIKAQRKLLSKHVVETKSKEVVGNLMQFLGNKKPSRILFYYSQDKEPDISEIVERCPTSQIFAPYFENDKWYIAQITGKEKLHKVFREISQPISPVKLLNSLRTAGFDENDIIFVPGIAFSTDGSRIGYGSGTYDKLLRNIKSIKIGICYEFQLLQNIPSESHDIKMDVIITEDSITKVSFLDPNCDNLNHTD